MAVPVPSFGAIVTGTGNLTPVLPAHVQDDVLVVAMATEDNVGLTTVAGWTEIAAFQQGTTGIILVAWWRRVGVAETVADPLLTKASGTGAGLAIAGKIAGVRTAGNPWSAAPVNQANGSGTTVSCGGGITTTVADTLLVFFAGNSVSSATPQTSGYAAATDPPAGSWTEAADQNVTTATGAGLAVATAPKTTPGATGALLATLATAAVNCGLAFEAIPLSAPVVPLPVPPGVFTPHLNPGAWF